MFLHPEEEKGDFEERMMERRIEIYMVKVSPFIFSDLFSHYSRPYSGVSIPLHPRI